MAMRVSTARAHQSPSIRVALWSEHEERRAKTGFLLAGPGTAGTLKGFGRASCSALRNVLAVLMIKVLMNGYALDNVMVRMPSQGERNRWRGEAR